MIIVLACAFVVGVEALALRGKLARLSSLRFRRFYLVWLALLDQVLVISVLPGHQHVALDIANLMSYVAAGAFLWSNRRIPGVLLVGVGGGLNVAAIVANGGTMPASSSALIASGWKAQPGHFANSAVVAHPKLAALGDIFATPRWFPAHDVFSIGDILIVVAVGILVYKTCSAVPVAHDLAQPSRQSASTEIDEDAREVADTLPLSTTGSLPSEPGAVLVEELCSSRPSKSSVVRVISSLSTGTGSSRSA